MQEDRKIAQTLDVGLPIISGILKYVLWLIAIYWTIFKSVIACDTVLKNLYLSYIAFAPYQLEQTVIEFNSIVKVDNVN